MHAPTSQEIQEATRRHIEQGHRVIEQAPEVVFPHAVIGEHLGMFEDVATLADFPLTTNTIFSAPLETHVCISARTLRSLGIPHAEADRLACDHGRRTATQAERTFDTLRSRYAVWPGYTKEEASAQASLDSGWTPPN